MVEEYGRCSDQADSIATVELSVVAIDQRNRISSRCYRTRIRYAPAWLLFEMWWCLVVVPKLGRFQNPERDKKKKTARFEGAQAGRVITVGAGKNGKRPKKIWICYKLGGSWWQEEAQWRRQLTHQSSTTQLRSQCEIQASRASRDLLGRGGRPFRVFGWKDGRCMSGGVLPLTPPCSGACPGVRYTNPTAEKGILCILTSSGSGTRTYPDKPSLKALGCSQTSTRCQPGCLNVN